MRIVLLGTTGYHPNDRRQTACMAIPELGIVLDAGTAMYRLRDGIVTDELDIFLTHAHLDHIVGLTFLLEVLHGKDMQRVTIHGDQKKLDAIQEHLFHPLLFPVPPDYEFRAIEQDMAVAGGGVVKHFPLQHPGGSLGYRFDWPGHSLAYVTDTTAFGAESKYLDQIRGVDLLLHECYFSDAGAQMAKPTGHSHTTPVAEVAAAAEVGCLVMVHLDPSSDEVDPVGLEDARKIFPETYLGEDGMVIEF